MSNPEVVEGLSDADWTALEKEAGSVTLRYLRTDDPSLEKRVKVATTVLSAATRRQASAGARDALNFAISRSIARTPEEMAEYVRLTQPSFPAMLGTATLGNARQGKAITSDGNRSQAEPSGAWQGDAEQGEAITPNGANVDAQRSLAEHGGARQRVAGQGKAITDGEAA